MIRACVFPFTALILLLAAPVASADTPRVSVQDFGVYETRTKKRIPHPHSATGEMNVVSELRFVRQARTIAAQLGRSFGWRYRLHGVPDNARITFRTVHPPLTNPATGESRKMSWRTTILKKPGNLRYTGYTFDYSWELAEGRWVFQIVYQGRVIGEQAFTVVIPLN